MANYIVEDIIIVLTTVDQANITATLRVLFSTSHSLSPYTTYPKSTLRRLSSFNNADGLLAGRQFGRKGGVRTSAPPGFALLVAAEVRGVDAFTSYLLHTVRDRTGPPEQQVEAH